jgi:hypothetical protein
MVATGANCQPAGRRGGAHVFEELFVFLAGGLDAEGEAGLVVALERGVLVRVEHHLLRSRSTA